MAASLRLAVQLIASILLYAILIWIGALIVSCVFGNRVSSPAIVFGIIHTAEAVALVVLLLALIRFPVLYFVAFLINAIFFIAVLTMFCLTATRTLGNRSFAQFKGSPPVHFFLIWEMIASIVLGGLLIAEGIQVPWVQTALASKRRSTRSSKLASPKRSRESFKAEVTPPPLKEATEKPPKAAKTVENVNNPGGIVEMNSEVIHDQDEGHQRSPALNEVRAGSDFEKELARALLM